MASLRRLTRREWAHATIRPGGDSSSPLRSAFRFGRRAWSADVLQFLNYRLDLFMLAACATRADVGRYSVAVSLTMLAWLAPAAIGHVLLPRTASLDSAAQTGRLVESRRTGQPPGVIRHTVVLQLPTGVAIVGILLVRRHSPLHGPPFHQSIGLGLLLSPGVLILSIAKVISSVVTGRGFPQYSVYNVLISVPVTLSLYFILIPPLGATGAALASSASSTLTTVVAMYFYRRATGSSVRGAVVRPLPTCASIPARHPNSCRRVRVARDAASSGDPGLIGALVASPTVEAIPAERQGLEGFYGEFSLRVGLRDWQVTNARNEQLKLLVADVLRCREAMRIVDNRLMHRIRPWVRVGTSGPSWKISDSP